MNALSQEFQYDRIEIVKVFIDSGNGPYALELSKDMLGKEDDDT